MAKNFKHDCSVCRWVGTLPGIVDLYLCYRRGETSMSLVARYGNDGPEYSSNTISTTEFDKLVTEGLDRYVTMINEEAVLPRIRASIVLRKNLTTIMNAVELPQPS